MARILEEVEWNRRRTRARLRFEDGSVITLRAATMRDTLPRPGQAYEADEIDGWERADARVRAREGALRLLDYRGRSVGELRHALLRRGHDEEAVREVADALTAAGLLDDVAYAEGYVRGRIARRPRGARALVLELRRRQVAEDVAQAAVARVLGDEGIGEPELARQAARGWLSRQAPDEVSRARAGEEEARERLYRRARGWLQRRGFAGDIAHQQVARLLGGETVEGG
jgi:regulatory protein